MARRREPLSRDRIVRVALELLDEEGLEALSMRRLAARMGVEAMSLYNYVRDKQDLLDGVVDLALAGIPPPDPAVVWDARVEAVGRGLYRTLVAHPAVVQILAAELALPRSMEVVRGMDALVGALAEGGLRPEHQVSAYRGLLATCLGFALTHTRGGTATRAQAEAIWQAEAPRWDAAAVPNLTRLGAQLRVTRPEDDFDFALGALLGAMRASSADGG